MESLADKVVKFFDEDNQFAQIIPGYRYRKEQVTLGEAIARAFENREFLIAEAGTGVGKTYAYLIPAIMWAWQEKEKVVISTKTKALQQQIVDRDAPALKEVLGTSFCCEEAKGRENYLCWYKYINLLAGRKRLNQGEQEFVSHILNWAEQTTSGDKKELTVESKLMKYWGVVAADRRSCLKGRCPYQEKCFRLKMLKRLQKADLIVVNHSLLLSDLIVDNSILPEYRYLIIDEAHTFDRESFEKLSTRFSRLETEETLTILGGKGDKYNRGYLRHLIADYPHLTSSLNETAALVEKALELTSRFFTLLGRRRNSNNDSSQVLTEKEVETDWFADIFDQYLEWQQMVTLIHVRLTDLEAELGEEPEEQELHSLSEILDECSQKAFVIMEEGLSQADHLTWIEYDKDYPTSICDSSIQIGQVLYSQLFQRLDTMVMLSATMAIEEKFDYFLNRFGLNHPDLSERVNTLLEKSPFCYDTQACLYSIADIPDPMHQGFAEEAAGVLCNILSVTGGRTMVLFTARKQLQEISNMVRPFCDGLGIKLLVQDQDGGFAAILEEYCRSENTVLMGLDTFWEGIDLKGDLLTCLVIVKLPFRAPSDPFCTASERYFTLQHKNSFVHFMLPDATIRFKQGIGRLIRSETDHGVVVVLDSRLQRRSYGKVFKNSIPINRVESLRKADLTSNIKAWI